MLWNEFSLTWLEATIAGALVAGSLAFPVWITKEIMSAKQQLAGIKVELHYIRQMLARIEGIYQASGLPLKGPDHRPGGAGAEPPGLQNEQLPNYFQ